MSHRVDLALALKDKGALRRACKALKIELIDGKQTVRLYSGEVEADASFKLPGWNYPVALNLKTGTVAFDNYNGIWGKQEELDKLAQEYTLQVAEHETGVQELIMRGWSPTRVKQPDGMIDLVLEEP